MNTSLKDQLTLKFASDPDKPGSGSVRVHGFDPSLCTAVAKDALAGDLLKSILRVSVLRAEPPEGDGLPDVFGRCQVLENELRFTPYFPFERGVTYRASFDPRPLGGQQPSEGLPLDFSLPQKPGGAPQRVSGVFPSGDTLPENLLRFYIRFSDPMQRGGVEKHIALLGPDGAPVSDVLYRTPVELWDRGMRHLTILLDPGRLKRGVGPHVELGPPLAAGREYTLAIGAGMIDSSGRPLRAGFRKRFRVAQAVRETVDVERWRIVPPRRGSRQPLVLVFPRELDWAMLFRAITVEATGGSVVDGEVVVGEGESQWSFTPAAPWSGGNYQVRVAPGLEDVCGNNVLAPFDGPLRSGSKLNGPPVASCLLTFQAG